MITLIAMIGGRTYEVESHENNRHYLVVKVGMGQVERNLLKDDGGGAITGYVAACKKAEAIVVEKTGSLEPA